MKKSRKLAWVVLGVVVVAVLATGIASWRSLLYEELARLTNQPVREGLRCEFRRPARNETLELFIPIWLGNRKDPNYPNYHIATQFVHMYEWPLSYVFVLKNRITNERNVIVLDLDGRQARPIEQISAGSSTSYSPYTKVAGQ